MTRQGVVEDSAPTKQSVRVSWFRRDPGGTTIFVMPAGDDGAAAQPIAQQPIAQCDDGAAIAHG